MARSVEGRQRFTGSRHPCVIHVHDAVKIEHERLPAVAGKTADHARCSVGVGPTSDSLRCIVIDRALKPLDSKKFFARRCPGLTRASKRSIPRLRNSLIATSKHGGSNPDASRLVIREDELHHPDSAISHRGEERLFETSEEAERYTVNESHNNNPVWSFDQRVQRPAHRLRQAVGVWPDRTNRALLCGEPGIEPFEVADVVGLGEPRADRHEGHGRHGLMMPCSAGTRTYDRGRGTTQGNSTHRAGM